MGTRLVEGSGAPRLSGSYSASDTAALRCSISAVSSDNKLGHQRPKINVCRVCAVTLHQTRCDAAGVIYSGVWDGQKKVAWRNTVRPISSSRKAKTHTASESSQ